MQSSSHQQEADLKEISLQLQSQKEQEEPTHQFENQKEQDFHSPESSKADHNDTQNGINQVLFQISPVKINDDGKQQQKPFSIAQQVDPDFFIEEQLSPPLRISRRNSILRKRTRDMENSIEFQEERKRKSIGINQTSDNRPSEVADGDASQNQFSSACQYWLSCIGYAVGFGNVWRFPYLVFTCGGGAFLVPYLLSVAIFGVPLFMMETAMGQVIRKSLTNIFKTLSQRVSFLPYGMLFGTFCVSIYYVLLISWSMLYFVYCFQTPLPWSNVDPDSGVFWDEKFFPQTILQSTDSISHFGGINWRMLLSSLASWTLIFLCMFKGISSTGKVVYVTTLLPYVLLFVFLIKAFTLQGVSIGLKFFFVPDWSRLTDFYVWVRAASQVLFSASLGVGTLIMYSSYRGKNEKVVKSSIIIPLINSGTSLLAGMILFGLLGHMAYQKGIDIASLPLQGPELAFVVYPAILTQLPGSNLWAIAFFAMLIMIGTSSAFGMVETFLHLVRQRVKYFKCKISNQLLTLIACAIYFVVSIIFASGAGIYMLELVDYYATSIPLTLGAILQTLALCWIFKLAKLEQMMTKQTGQKFPLYVKICLKFISPLFLTLILIFSLIASFKNALGFPGWAVFVGIMLFLLPSTIMIIGVLQPECRKLRNKYPRLQRCFRRCSRKPQQTQKNQQKFNQEQEKYDEDQPGSGEHILNFGSEVNVNK